MFRIMIFLIILSLPVQIIFSQNPEIITAEKAVKLASDNNLIIKKENYSLSAKKRSKNTRFNAFIPEISAGPSLSKANEKPALGEYHWNLSTSIQAQLTLSLALFDGIRYLSADYQNGLIEREDAVKQLKRDTLKSFYNLILMRENLVLIEKNIETAEKRYRQADTNFRNGLVSELDRLRARVSYEQLKPDHVELKNSYKKAMLSFKQMLGLEKRVKLLLKGK